MAEEMGEAAWNPTRRTLSQISNKLGAKREESYSYCKAKV
jgi:hypothetical protein